MFSIFDPQFWIIAVVAVALVALVVLAIKYESARKVLIGIICVVVVGSGAYSAYQLHGYYSASGGIYGKIFGVESTTVQVDDMEFNFLNMELLETENNTHEAKVETSEVFGLDVNQTYEITVNGEPCKMVTHGEEYAVAEYTYNFYDGNQSCVMSDTLTFRFSFFSNKTVLVVSTSGGDDAVKYWNSYFNNNTFIVGVRPNNEIYSQDSELEFGEYVETENEFVVATFYTGDEVYLKKVAKTGGKITFPTNPDLLMYWSYDGENIIEDSEVTLTEDTSFYVVYYDPDNSEDFVQPGEDGTINKGDSNESSGELIP